MLRPGLALLPGLVLASGLAIDPVADQRALEASYRVALPGVELRSLASGVAAIDAGVAASHAEFDAFPPWEIGVDEGRTAYAERFPDGAGYADCLGTDPGAVRPRFPHFDPAAAVVVTLEVALNSCREAHGAAPLDYGSAPMNALCAYLTAAARGRELAPAVPADAAALAAYASGREVFHSRRGRLELACADCHVRAVGKRLRDVTLGPALGVVGRFPIYSLRSGSLGSLHGRFQGCYRVVRAEPLAAQSADYRNLEYYLTVISRGYPITGPGLLR